MTDAVNRALARVNRRVLDWEGVAGTALGTSRGAPCIKVYLEKDDKRLRSRLPRSEDGVPVVAEVTGRFRRW